MESKLFPVESKNSRGAWTQKLRRVKSGTAGVTLPSGGAFRVGVNRKFQLAPFTVVRGACGGPPMLKIVVNESVVFRDARTDY